MSEKRDTRQEPSFFVSIQGPADVIANGEHLYVWLQVRPQTVSPQEGSQRSHFEVDGLGGRPFLQTTLLELSDVVGGDGFRYRSAANDAPSAATHKYVASAHADQR